MYNGYGNEHDSDQLTLMRTVAIVSPASGHREERIIHSGTRSHWRHSRTTELSFACTVHDS